MKRILIRIAYDGTKYHGFAKNNEVDTIEGRITTALKEILRIDPIFIGASRTDAGVHAFGNVGVFDTSLNIDADRYVYALNSKLPDDIKVIDSIQVRDDFHPRHTDVVKNYEYVIDCGRIKNPLLVNYSWNVYGFDKELLIKALKRFEGRHDFLSFCTMRKEGYASTVRTIHEISLAFDELNKLLRINFYGDGFLYNMIRIIVGSAMDVALGRKELDFIDEAFEKRDRSYGGRTAPGGGLYLKYIYYKELNEDWITKEKNIGNF